VSLGEPDRSGEISRQALAMPTVNDLGRLTCQSQGLRHRRPGTRLQFGESGEKQGVASSDRLLSRAAMYHRMLSAVLLCTIVTVSAPGAGGFVQTSTAGGARAEGRSGMVSSAHPLATEAGLEILRAGGTAYEAAVAVAAALNAVEPAMSGLGGYGTILTWDARDQRVRFLNASGRIPIATNSDLFRAPTPEFEKNRTGAKAVSTPGNLHAWEALARRRSRLKWADLFTPAIRLAERGFVLREADARTIASAYATFPPHAKAFYGRDGKALGAGDRLVQQDLATTMKRIAAKGPDVFYKGEITVAIQKAMLEAGGFLSTEDLRRDKAEWWDAIQMEYRGYEIYTASPPANAFDYLVRLGLMSQFVPKELGGHNTVSRLHHFAEVTKHGFWVRLRWAGDPDVAAPPIERLLSREYWQQEAANDHSSQPAAVGGAGHAGWPYDRADHGPDGDEPDRLPHGPRPGHRRAAHQLRGAGRADGRGSHSRARARCARGHGPQGADHTGAGERARAHDRIQLRQSARPVRGRSRSARGRRGERVLTPGLQTRR